MTRLRPGPWTGSALRDARVAAGLSQNALAAALRVFPGCERTRNQHVRRWESGTVPNANALLALSAVLNVSMGVLMAR